MGRGKGREGERLGKGSAAGNGAVMVDGAVACVYVYLPEVEATVVGVLRLVFTVGDIGIEHIDPRHTPDLWVGGCENKEWRVRCKLCRGRAVTCTRERSYLGLPHANDISRLRHNLLGMEGCGRRKGCSCNVGKQVDGELVHMKRTERDTHTDTEPHSLDSSNPCGGIKPNWCLWVADQEPRRVCTSFAGSFEPLIGQKRSTPRSTPVKISNKQVVQQQRETAIDRFLLILARAS